jgi:hypothetical protein
MEQAESAPERSLFRKMAAAVKPSRGRGHSFNLGKRWEWISHPQPQPHGAAPDTAAAPARVGGKLSGGERCQAAHVDRSTTVTFMCTPGAEKLGRVTESSTCAYAVELETPAAC